MKTRKNVVPWKSVELHNDRIYKVGKSSGIFLSGLNYEVQVAMMLKAGRNGASNIPIANDPLQEMFLV